MDHEWHGAERMMQGQLTESMRTILQKLEAACVKCLNDIEPSVCVCVYGKERKRTCNSGAASLKAIILGAAVGRFADPHLHVQGKGTKGRATNKVTGPISKGRKQVEE